MTRRLVVMQERIFLQDSGVVTEMQCDLGEYWNTGSTGVLGRMGSDSMLNFDRHFQIENKKAFQSNNNRPLANGCLGVNKSI